MIMTLMWLGVDFVKPQVYNNYIITGLQQGVTNKKIIIIYYY
jgi:hypothetical protein